MVRGILILLVLAAAAVPGHSQERAPIDGAFGYQLGATWQPEAGSAGKREADGDFFFVTPPQPFQSFSEYFVAVTPSSGVIFEISGSRQFDSPAGCMAEMGLVEAKLDAKYSGGIISGTPSLSARRIVYRRYWERQIVLSCNLGLLLIVYLDPELHGASKSEMAELQKQVDSKGL